MAHCDGVVLDVDERPQLTHWVGLSLQHMFSMFGSTVLVPILVGLNPGLETGQLLSLPGSSAGHL